MTIEIADRLVKLRKKYGYSQEELADKLGLSRQAVSKWERAEASPDTDNLICLAKIYGVSLDELLSTDEDVDTIVKEQVKEEKKSERKVEVEGGTITLQDDDGKKVIINNHGVQCCDKDGKVVVKKPKDKFLLTLDIIDCVLTTFAIITYIFLGVFLKMWINGWIFFFVPEIVCSILRAIHKKNANNVNAAFISLFAFFFVCLFIPGLEANLWHPMWTVFLFIPVYHVTCSSINKILGKEEDNNGVKEPEEPTIDND